MTRKCLVDEFSPELLEEMAARLRLLAHPTRLQVVDFLQNEGYAPVRLITDHLRLAQAATSQHLTAMKRAGLLASERRGKEVWYRIADPRALTILDCMRKKKGARS